MKRARAIIAAVVVIGIAMPISAVAYCMARFADWLTAVAHRLVEGK